MSTYSKEEIEGFEKKDLRINRVAILKSLIESGKVGVNEVKENCELAEQYVNFVYNGLQCKTETKQLISNALMVYWIQIARELNIPEPNETNIKILDILWVRYSKEFKLSANPSILLGFIWDKWGKYPTTKESVETVLKHIKQN